MKQLYFSILLLMLNEISFSQNICGTAVPITVPYNSGTVTTCGTGNDYTSSIMCDSWAGNGEDYVFSLQVTNAPVVYSISLSGGPNVGKVASIHSACPPSPTNAIGCIRAGQENGYTATGNIQFPANGTYYIIVDSYWDYPYQTGPVITCTQFNLSVNVLNNLAPNDECSNATTIIAGTEQSCGTYISSTTINASSSTNITYNGDADDDVWFKFVATATAHTIELHDISPDVRMGYQLLTLHPTTPACTNMGAFSGTGGGWNAGTKGLYYGLVPGQTYYIRVYTAGTHHANFKICIYGVPPKPANDECSGAIDLTPSSQLHCTTPVRGTTNGATRSDGPEPTCYQPDENDDDVWYSFTATNSAHMIRATNVTNRVAISLYSGSCAGFTEIMCREESLTATGLTPGTKYYVRVYTPVPWRYYRADFDICVSAAPTNEYCTNAITLSVSSSNICSTPTRGVTSSSNNLSETAPSCYAAGTGDAVWYKFTATATTHTVWLSRPDVTSAIVNGPVVVAAYSGVCGTLVQLPGACTTSNEGGMVLNTLTVGATYYLRVFTADATQNRILDFDICVGLPPLNDECTGAVQLNTNGAIVKGSTVGATQSISTSNTACIDNAHNDDVWYRFTASNNSHTIAITDANTPTMAAVYSGNCSSPTFITGGCAQGGVSLNGLTAGQIYYVRVYSTSTDANLYSDFSISVLSGAPSNDECINAVTIGGATSGTTAGATQSLAPETCGTTTATSAKDVWFKFTANFNGSTVIKITNPSLDFNPAVTVFSGNCGNLTRIGCANTTERNMDETLTVYDLTAGSTYYVRVYGYDGVPGTFSINVYGAALPVELISFTGTRVNNQNIIRWTTASEKNNAGFELQSSTDAVTFKPVAFIATKSSNGFSSTQLHYEYTDIISGGTVWYRLKQVDKDGKAWYSNILTIRGENVKGFTLATFPNPSQGNITLKTVTDKAVAGTIVIRDLTGRKMMEQQVTLIRGESQITLSTGKLPAGTYILQVTSTEGVLQGITKIVRL